MSVITKDLDRKSNSRQSEPANWLKCRRLKSRLVHAVSFPGRPAAKGRPPSRPFVLLADDGPVCELSRLIGVAMKANGLKSADHFVPHMTLAYDKKFIPRQPIDPISFVAREFVLVHSPRGLTIYKDLNRWPLMAAP